jgi:hypothetical protein
MEQTININQTTNPLTLTTKERKAVTEMFNSIYYSTDSNSEEHRTKLNNLSPTLLKNIHKFLLNSLSYKDLPDTLYYGLCMDELVKMKVYPEEIPTPIMGIEYASVYKKVIEYKEINLDGIDGDKVVEDLIHELSEEYKNNQEVNENSEEYKEIDEIKE